MTASFLERQRACVNYKQAIIHINEIDDLNELSGRRWPSHEPLLVSDWLRRRATRFIHHVFDIIDAEPVALNLVDVPWYPAELVVHPLRYIPIIGW